MVNLFTDTCPMSGFSMLEFPTGRGTLRPNGGVLLEQHPLPTDPVGSMTLTLTNVVPGSSYDVEVLGLRTLVTKGVAAGSALNLTIPVYVGGSPNNQLVIKVRKASSSPAYQSYETQVTAAVGAQSIFINQLLDE